MDRINWENTLVNLQAFARGYLVRNEVRRARNDFEDIVQEIDGGLSHLQWRDTVIAIPHFTDTHGPFLRVSSSTSSPSEPGLHVSVTQNSSGGTDTCLPQEREGDRGVLLQRIEAERDEPQTGDHDCDSRAGCSNNSVEDAQRQRGLREQQDDNDGGAMESVADSTSVWSSLNLDMNCSHSQKGSQQFCLAQEVPRTSEALRAHRKCLTMELVWLQQAIDSRKKYLSLRDRLSIT
ncbi:IQ domain-containing protein C [Betta splendens]|uniref:IQ domain-containing protein C n=1 Tax=Betta splendens TaxID=158456 RepID=A0A6P7LMQ4_BETSP|nr:IQ domain-containing protein C [Betta splendens]